MTSPGAVTTRTSTFVGEADCFYDIIKEIETFSLTNGQVKFANQKYNSGRCFYQIILNQYSELNKITLRYWKPRIVYHFVEITKVKEQ